MEKENWSLIEAKGEIPVIIFKFPNDSNQSFLHIDIVVKKHEYVLEYFVHVIYVLELSFSNISHILSIRLITSI